MATHTDNRAKRQVHIQKQEPHKEVHENPTMNADVLALLDRAKPRVGPVSGLRLSEATHPFIDMRHAQTFAHYLGHDWSDEMEDSFSIRISSVLCPPGAAHPCGDI